MIQTKAIVLSAIKFQETSLIVRCYTQQGVRSYLLKGVLRHKKKAITPAYFQPLSQLELITTDRQDGTLEYIKEVRVSYPYRSLQQSVIRSSVLFFLSEIGCQVLQEEVANASLFSFWEENLQWYDRAEHFANFHLKFLTDLTFHLGVLPNTSALELPYFDLEAGVFVPMHNGHFLMSESESLLLKFFLTHSMEEVCQLRMSREERNDLLEQLLNYYRWHLPSFKIPHSWEVLKSIL